MSCFIDDDLLSPLSLGKIDEDIKFWIRHFLEQKRAEGLAKKTEDSYEDALKTFLEFVKKHKTHNTMQTIGAKFINRYLIEYQALLASRMIKELKKQNILDEFEKYDEVIKQQYEKHLGRNDADFKILVDFQNSLEHRLTVVKMLLKHISDNNEEEHDYTIVFNKLKTIRLKEKLADYIEIEELDRVVEFMREWPKSWNTDGNKFKEKYNINSAYRDSLLILLYALTGARSEEVIKIRLEDITLFDYQDSQYYSIKIREGKGGKIREVAVESGLIKEHIQFLEKELPNKNYYISSVFKKGIYINKPYHQDSIRRFGNYILSLLGINKTGLHTFRRGYATKRIMYDGAELSLVAKELGNSSFVLEKHYLRHSAAMSIKQTAK